MADPLSHASDMATLLRSRDWAATSLGTMATWSDRMLGVVDLVLASPLVASVVLGHERRLIYNAVAAELYGERHPAALGRPIAEAFPDSYPLVAPLYDRAFRGEAVRVAAEPLPITGRGEMFDAYLTPVRDADGTVVGVHMVGLEIGERVRMEAALREREADLMRVQRIGRVGGLDIDVAGGLVSWRSPEFLRLHGLGPENAHETHADWRARVHPDDVDEAERRLFDALAGAAFSYDHEYRIVRPSDGVIRWINARVDIERDASGRATRMVGAHLDVTDQKRMQEALHASEARQAFLLKLSDALRPLTDAAELERAAVTLLGRELGANRVFYATMDEGDAGWSVAYDYCDGVPSIVGHYDLTPFQHARMEQWRAGCASSVADSAVCSTLRADERASYAAAGIRAAIGMPLVHGGRFVALLVVNQVEPRDWSEAELALTRETAERTWSAIERARAEAAVRASEERFRALVTAGTLSIYRMSPDWRLMYQLDSQTLADTAQPIENWIDKYIPASDLPAVRGAIDTAIRTKSLFQLEHRVWAADGGIAWVLSRAVPLLGPDGEIVEWFGAGSVVTERKEAEEALRDSEERYRALFESMDEAYAVVEVLKDDAGAWSDFRFVAVNPAFMVHTHMPYPVGRTATELLGTPNSRWTALYGEALDTGETLRVEEGEPTLGIVLDLNIFALDPARNRVAVLFTNITERKRAEAALRDREEQLRAMIELVPALLWSTSADGRTIRLNERWLSYTGQNDAETQDFGWLAAVHPDDFAATRAAFAQAFATGEPLERQQRLHKAGDGWRWHLVRQVPVRDDEGRILRWFGAAVDIHESKLAERALDESERWLQTLMAGVPQLVWRASAPGVWTWASPQWTEYTGQAEADSHGWGWLDPVHPDDRDGVRASWAAADARGAFHADYRICNTGEGRYRWFQTRATPVRGSRGEIIEWLGTSTDVDDLRSLQERQRILVAELQHRTRNLMALVRSTADRTAETSADIADFRQRFRDRLGALSRVQGLLSRLNDTDRITFDELIRTEIQAMDGAADRVTLDGPEGIRLRSSMVQTLAMALHELATNAVKYGALGQSDGRLTIAWHMTEPDRHGRPRLRIDWRESGVTMPAPGSAPQGGGQGRELIERALPYQLSAETRFELGPDGVRCAITIPVSTSTERIGDD